MKINNIKIYTDGSSRGNPGKGGYGVVIFKDETDIHNMNEKNAILYSEQFDHVTNNQMEMKAVIYALEFILKFQIENTVETLEIYTDSKYVINGIETWIFNWMKNGWKTSAGKLVLNMDLWKNINDLVNKIKINNTKIIWNYVKGHAENKWNNLADLLATDKYKY